MDAIAFKYLYHIKYHGLILEGTIKKNFLWASRLWVGRRKEPILGYVPKNDEKKNSGGTGLIGSEYGASVLHLLNRKQSCNTEYSHQTFHKKNRLVQYIQLIPWIRLSCLFLQMLSFHPVEEGSCLWVSSLLSLKLGKETVLHCRISEVLPYKSLVLAELSLLWLKMLRANPIKLSGRPILSVNESYPGHPLVRMFCLVRKAKYRIHHILRRFVLLR